MQTAFYPVKRRQDGGQILGGCHQIDIVRACVLQFQKNFRQSLICDLFSESLAAYGIILAEAAAESAACKEYGAAAIGSADTWFLPVVQHSSCGCQFMATLTVTFAQMTVCMAVPWAELTIFIFVRLVHQRFSSKHFNSLPKLFRFINIIMKIS